MHPIPVQNTLGVSTHGIMGNHRRTASLCHHHRANLRGQGHTLKTEDSMKGRQRPPSLTFPHTPECPSQVASTQQNVPVPPYSSSTACLTPGIMGTQASPLGQSQPWGWGKPGQACNAEVQAERGAGCPHMVMNY